MIATKTNRDERIDPVVGDKLHRSQLRTLSLLIIIFDTVNRMGKHHTDTAAEIPNQVLIEHGEDMQWHSNGEGGKTTVPVQQRKTRNARVSHSPRNLEQKLEGTVVGNGTGDIIVVPAEVLLRNCGFVLLPKVLSPVASTMKSTDREGCCGVHCLSYIQ